MPSDHDELILRLRSHREFILKCHQDPSHVNTLNMTEDGTAPTLDEALTRIHNFFKNFHTMRLPELYSVRAFRMLRTKTVKLRKAELGLLFNWHMDLRLVHILRNMAVRLTG